MAAFGGEADVRSAPNLAKRQSANGQEQPLQTDNVTDESDAPLLVPDRFYSSQTPVAYS